MPHVPHPKKEGLTMSSEAEIQTQQVNPTIKTAIIVGIFAALSVVVVHFLFSIMKAIDNIPYGLSWGTRGRFIELDTLTKTGKLGHLIDILGFPRTGFGFIPNSIFYGVLFGCGYYVWRCQKDRLLRWSLFEPPSQQQSPHSKEEGPNDRTFCRLRVTTCCLMPMLRDAKHRTYYYDPQDPSKQISSSHLLSVRCPLCGAKNWHVNPWSIRVTLPTRWVRSLQKYKGDIRRLPSKLKCADEEE
jgi:hypothetical protein